MASMASPLRHGQPAPWSKLAPEHSSSPTAAPGSRKRGISVSVGAASAGLVGAAGAVSVLGSFTPLHALLGGLLIGVSVVAQLLLLGRVLGVSGAVKGIVQLQPHAWRYAFVAGMLLASVPLALLVPSAFQSLPPSYSFGRAVVGGALVGFGSALGNGCTSGHAICGLARLSKRSLTYTIIFMATGMIVATATGAAAAAGIATAAPVQLVWPSSAVTQLWVGLLAASSVAFAALGSWSLSLSTEARKSLEVATTVCIGAVFASGLTLSGMTLPPKVLAFLSPLMAAWDPSLALVMIGAISLAVIGYQGVMGGLDIFPQTLRSVHPPNCAVVGKPMILSSYNIPTSVTIDWQLVLGGVLFGAGWGLSGICPGPAIVALGGSVGLQALNQKVAAYLGGMVLGMLAETQFVQGLNKQQVAKPATS